MSQVLNLHLASARTPPEDKPELLHPGELGRYKSTWIYDGRDLIRKLYVGRTVKVQVDYVKPGRGEGKDKIFATVKDGTFNLAAVAIAEGLATVVLPASINDPRSSELEGLKRTEVSAKKRCVGVHGKASPKFSPKVLPPNHQLVHKSLPLMQSRGKVKAVVEEIMRDWEFRLYSLDYGYIINFVMAGVSKKEFSHEAKVHLQTIILQRDVIVQFLDIDDDGKFMGEAVWGQISLSDDEIVILRL